MMKMRKLLAKRAITAGANQSVVDMMLNTPDQVVHYLNDYSDMIRHINKCQVAKAVAVEYESTYSTDGDSAGVAHYITSYTLTCPENTWHKRITAGHQQLEAWAHGTAMITICDKNVAVYLPRNEAEPIAQATIMIACGQWPASTLAATPRKFMAVGLGATMDLIQCMADVNRVYEIPADVRAQLLPR